MRKLGKVFVASFLALSLCGCGGNDAAGSNETEGAVKVGFIGPLTGDYAVYGVGQRNSALLAIKDYNAKGGTQFVLVDEDSQGDNTSAVNAYNKLVDSDKVVGIMGAAMSGETASVTAASEAIGTPVISASATALEATKAQNSFRGCFTDPMQAEFMAGFVKDKGYSKIAILYNKDSDYAVGLTENFSKNFTELGGSVVIQESYSDGDKDFNTQLTKIAAADIDSFFIPNYYGDNVLIAKQARDLGIDVQLFGGDGWDGVLSISDDSSAFEGVLFTNGYSPDDAKIQEYIAKYTAEFKDDGEPNNFAFLAYDAMTALLTAYDHAQTKDNEGIVEAMRQTDLDGILGNLKFDENGDPIRKINVVTVKDGRYASAN